MDKSIIVAPLRLCVFALILLVICGPTPAQSVRVGVRKLSTPIPKACEGVTPADIEGRLDIAALKRGQVSTEE